MSEPTAERILFHLKTKAPLTAADLARLLAITPMGVRQHLTRLAEDGLVMHTDERHSVGRPKRQWRLSAKAEGRFPDSHAQVTVELIGAVAKLFGPDGLERLIAERERDTLSRYRQGLEGAKTLKARLQRLARLRCEEGYMAEVLAAPGGGALFVENHCPVCAAARACQGFCRSELEIFKALLPDHSVERVDHILAGARRCAYLVQPRRTPRH
ncbi:MAG: transcriptional regulator [Proteobacteria bacterium]|nr:transcriptional regulator [Pseudomonadota bacterium]MBI3496452.1 transcriptional regulator [Pseudomonadota bacterium]